MEMPVIWIRDKEGGDIREFGTDAHDRLYIDKNGHIQYVNLQNGVGSPGCYEFVLDAEGHNQHNLPYTEEEQAKYMVCEEDCYFEMVEPSRYGIRKLKERIDTQDKIIHELLTPNVKRIINDLDAEEKVVDALAKIKKNLEAYKEHEFDERQENYNRGLDEAIEEIEMAIDEHTENKGI